MNVNATELYILKCFFVVVVSIPCLFFFFFLMAATKLVGKPEKRTLGTKPV